MRPSARTATPVTVLLPWVLAACGGVSNAPTATTDAGVWPDGALRACGDLGGSSCNPVLQTGCATGICQVQPLYSGLTAFCSGSRPMGLVGTQCGGSWACAPGLVCSGNRCTPLCCGPGDDARCRSFQGADANSTCSRRLLAEDGRDLSQWTCSVDARCDWFAQNCLYGGTCVAEDATGTTVCVPTGSVAEGGTCGGASNALCQRGLLCVRGSTTADTGTCRKICDASGASVPGRGCPSGRTCQRLHDRPSNFGACQP